MSTKFIGIDGFEKIQNLETSKQRKRTLKRKNFKNKITPSNIFLTIIYLLFVIPSKAIVSGLKAIKNFSFKKFVKSLTPKKVVCNFAAPVGAIVLLVLTIGYWTNYINFGLAVQCGGETVAAVTDTGVIEQAKEITNDKLNQDVDASFTPVYQVAVMDNNNTSVDADQVSDAMVSSDNTVTNNVSGLYVDGKLIGACKSETLLNKALDNLLVKDRQHYDSKTYVGFYNKVEVREGIFSNDDIMTANEIIQKANRSNLLQVLVKTDIVLTERVPYSTKVKYDENMDSSYSKVMQKGKAGSQKTTYRVSYLDGVQVDAVIKNIKTIKKPVNKVVVKGKGEEAGENYSAGTSSVSDSGFMWPVPSVHTISSNYGYRDGGEFHTGLDISDGNCYGNEIVASMSGTVEWAGYDDSGYGNYVIINHGNGYKTLYGHCSAVYVSQGQSVSQGETIAAIGNTGQSYGAHLHFEVRTGDDRSDRQNPLNYVSN